VEGDIHDIAKDIVVFMLDVNGFDVMDLGVDVPVAKFVEAVKSFKPQVVGLSGFLTLAYDPMKNTVQALVDAGLRDSVKVMIGGGQMDDQVAAYAKADAYGKDAMAAVTLSKGWVGVK
jgi:methanogenic corrinoid protein MtbC1